MTACIPRFMAVLLLLGCAPASSHAQMASADLRVELTSFLRMFIATPATFKAKAVASLKQTKAQLLLAPSLGGQVSQESWSGLFRGNLMTVGGWLEALQIDLLTNNPDSLAPLLTARSPRGEFRDMNLVDDGSPTMTDPGCASLIGNIREVTGKNAIDGIVAAYHNAANGAGKVSPAIMANWARIKAALNANAPEIWDDSTVNLFSLECMRLNTKTGFYSLDQFAAGYNRGVNSSMNSQLGKAKSIGAWSEANSGGSWSPQAGYWDE